MLQKLNKKKASYQEEQRLIDLSINELKTDYTKKSMSSICNNMVEYHKKSSAPSEEYWKDKLNAIMGGYSQVI